MMSDVNQSEPPASPQEREKKRRLHGACDACRKKKVKCDSAKMPDNVCTNCRSVGVFCAHTMGRSVKKKDTQTSYIRSLEQRLSKMERSLQDIRPENDPPRDSSIPSDETHTPSPSAEGPSIPSTSYPASIYPVARSISTKHENPPSAAASDGTSEAEDLAHVTLTNQLNQLAIANLEERFYGQSSPFMFFAHTSNIRSQVTGSSDRLDAGKQFRRPVYWEIRPWEMEFAAVKEPVYQYPEDDLLENLVSTFFEKINVIYPLLHQPTFRKSLSSRKHIWDSSFGMTVLLVCAVGSRYSNDPRVMLPGDTSGLSSGWMWFSQVPMHRNSLLYRSSIYDLQYFVLSSMYLISSGVAHAAWSVLGHAMRIAQEKGLHRRKGHNEKPTAEGELSKRAFWCMIALDRVKSSFLGRPYLMQDEDFDVEYPIECDDEYWETDDPELAFKQPPGKPSIITAFVCHLKLSEILLFTLRTLYATKKSKSLAGYAGEEWDRRIVAELDSSMNKWKDTLPQFLHWDPIRQQHPFFDQSAHLHALYYYLQILIHRPFLTKKSSLSFPSLAMCTSAARACSKVVELGQLNRCAPYQLIISAFTSGIVIALNLWGHKKSGLVTQPASELESLQRCRKCLQDCESRFHIAGRFRDMLDAISNFGPPPVSEIEATPRVIFPSRHVPPPLPQHQNIDNLNSYPSTTPMTTMNAPSVFSACAQPPVGLTNTNNNPPAPALFSTELNWDINNLLLLQMAHSKANLGDNMDVYSDDNLYSTGIFAPDAHMFEDMKMMNNSGVGVELTADEMVSLWSDIPASFSVDEWNAYLTNFGTTQP